jgi:hypothetical protein
MGRMVSWKRADWLAITVARIPCVYVNDVKESLTTDGAGSSRGGARTVPCPYSGHITH